MTAAARLRGPRASGAATPARRCALGVLRRVFADGAFADRAFGAEVERAGLEGRERALAERLAFGAVQRRATLDHVVAACSDRALETIDPPLLDALRLGVLQLLFLDSVPDRAAVEQTVELAREAAGERATGFVNAVMRRAAREGRGVLDALDDSTPAGAAVRHSHPRWMAELWWEALGGEHARALLAHDNEPPEAALRVNELVTTPGEALGALRRAGAPARPAAWPREAVILEGPMDLARSPLFASGALTPQSRASMLVARVAAPQPGERVLDLCAAPGAKTTHLAALMRGRGTLMAVERHPRRAAALADNARRLHADLVQVVTIGLLKSIERYDPDRGGEFSTYATPTIVGEIKRHFRDKGWAVRVPRRLQELRLQLTTATATLSQDLGRSPTVAELGIHLKISPEEVLEGLESANAYSTLSLDAPDLGDDERPAVADTLGHLDEALEGVEYRESLKPLLAQLPEREKRILLLRFFGGMTQSQIAEQVGISQMHVSRLLARTLAQLREGLLTEE